MFAIFVHEKHPLDISEKTDISEKARRQTEFDSHVLIVFLQTEAKRWVRRSIKQCSAFFFFVDNTCPSFCCLFCCPIRWSAIAALANEIAFFMPYTTVYPVGATTRSKQCTDNAPGTPANWNRTDAMFFLHSSFHSDRDARWEDRSLAVTLKLPMVKWKRKSPPSAAYMARNVHISCPHRRSLVR